MQFFLIFRAKKSAALHGYAFYVWLAVALTVLPLAALVAHSATLHRVILRDIARQRAREARRRAAREAT